MNLQIDKDNETKLQKHGLTIEQIKIFFNSSPSYTKDEAHSTEEEKRYIAFGPFEESFIFVAFTFRMKGKKLFYRPISARFAHKKEIKRLYENIKE